MDTAAHTAVPDLGWELFSVPAAVCAELWAGSIKDGMSEAAPESDSHHDNQRDFA